MSCRRFDAKDPANNTVTTAMAENNASVEDEIAHLALVLAVSLRHEDARPAGMLPLS
jgi:hypothetical protein